MGQWGGGPVSCLSGRAGRTPGALQGKHRGAPQQRKRWGWGLLFDGFDGYRASLLCGLARPQSLPALVPGLRYLGPSRCLLDVQFLGQRRAASEDTGSPVPLTLCAGATDDRANRQKPNGVRGVGMLDVVFWPGARAAGALRRARSGDESVRNTRCVERGAGLWS